MEVVLRSIVKWNKATNLLARVNAVYDLLHLMYQDGHLSSTELHALQKTCRELNENPVRVLRSLNMASPVDLQGLLQKFYGVSAVTDALILALDESFKTLIPIDVALHYSVFAVSEEGETLHVAMEDPTDKRTVNQLRFLLERKIVPVVATVHQLAAGLTRIYDLTTSQLKLSTVIDASRGFVGGVKYENDAPEIPLTSREQSVVDRAVEASFGLPETGLHERPEASSDAGDAGTFGLENPFSPEERAHEPTRNALAELAGAFDGPNDVDESGDDVLAEQAQAEPKAAFAEVGPAESEASDAVADVAADVFEEPAETEVSLSEFADAPLGGDADAPEARTEREPERPDDAPTLDLTPAMLSNVTAAANAALVKIMLARDRSVALAVLNARLGAHGIKIDESAEGELAVVFMGAQVGLEAFDDPRSAFAPLAQSLRPVLRKIASLP